MTDLLHNCPSHGEKIPSHCPLCHLCEVEKYENFVNNKENQRHGDKKQNRGEPSAQSESLDERQKTPEIATRGLDEKLVPKTLFKPIVVFPCLTQPDQKQLRDQQFVLCPQ